MNNPKEKKSYERKGILIGVVLISLLVFLSIIFSFYLYRNIQTARRASVLAGHASLTELLQKHKQLNQISPADADYINTWMTFKYINVVFNMPDSFLKERLSINAVNYPNLTLGRYINENHLNSATFIEDVKSAVRDYFKSQTSN